MRIVFAGCVDFSRHCLEELLAAGGDVVGVVTIVEELVRAHTDYVDLEPIARERGIPSRRVRNINEPESLAWIREREPDVLFIFGWSQLLGEELLELAPGGAIGTHPGLIELHRGRNTIQWAIASGHDRSGLAFFYLDEGMDTGDILWQGEFPIALEDDAADVYEKLKHAAAAGIREFLPQLAAGTAPRVAQDHGRATYWPKRTDEDRVLHWYRPTRQLYDLVRALARPYIGAVATVDREDVLVWRARLPVGALPPGAEDAAPGVVLRSGPNGIDVRTGDGYLTLVELEPLAAHAEARA